MPGCTWRSVQRRSLPRHALLSSPVRVLVTSNARHCLFARFLSEQLEISAIAVAAAGYNPSLDHERRSRRRFVFFGHEVRPHHQAHYSVNYSSVHCMVDSSETIHFRRFDLLLPAYHTAPPQSAAVATTGS